jgi:hypothetical protein
MKLEKCLLSWAVFLVACSAGVVRAETVTWTIDSDEKLDQDDHTRSVH